MPHSLRAILLLVAVGAVIVGTLAAAMMLPGAMMLIIAAGGFAFTGLLFFWNWPGDVRRQRRERGQCLQCGYDLRGNVSGVCPECGSAT